MSREKQIDYKEYARQMRQNCARDYNGTEPIVICSSELWEEIATIIDDFDKQSEGEWKTEDTILGKCCVCSVCGSCPTMEYKYCPYCGAKMKGGAE